MKLLSIKKLFALAVIVLQAVFIIFLDLACDLMYNSKGKLVNVSFSKIESTI